MNWDTLTQDIIAASKISFSDLLRRHGAEKFYAFILYTDNDCYAVLPSANSIERHNEKISKRNVIDQKNIAGYKWHIGEWAYEAWGEDGFNKICTALSTVDANNGK
jgi:hypothetical protein